MGRLSVFSSVVMAGFALFGGRVSAAAPAPAPASLQLPALVRIADLFRDRRVIEVSDFTVVGSVAYMMRADGGLFRTDGTEKGTTLISAISAKVMPGPYAKIVGFQTQIFWLGVDKALWVSDGTPSGTHWFWRGETVTPSPPFVVGGSLYFFADGRLYRSDGTVANTQAVTNISAIGEALVDGNVAYFTCLKDDGSAALCATDGTSAGTRVVGTLPLTPSLRERAYGVVGGHVLVFGDLGLWSVNVSSGSVVELLSPPFQGLGAAKPPPPVLLGGFAYFPCNAGAGVELCRTDGTFAGTSALDLLPGPAGSSPQVTRLGDRLILQADRGTVGRELYTSDGTLAGTTLLIDRASGPTSGVAETRLVTVGDLVYFAAVSADGFFRSLSRTDGTASGTVVLQAGGIRSAFDIALDDVAVLGGKLLFGNAPTFPIDPWISDGTVAGTKRIAKVISSDLTAAEIRAYPVGDRLCVSTAGEFVSLGDLPGQASMLGGDTVQAATPTAVYFASQGALSRTDCAGKTELVKLHSGLFSQIATVGERLVLRTATRVVWFSDGTADGTSASDLTDVSFLARARDAIWMVQGGKILKSDGTRSGTTVVKEIRSTPIITHAIISFGLYVALVVTVDGSRMELWRSDGTNAGTFRLKQLAAPGADNPPPAVYAWNDTLYFGVSGFDHGELWRTNNGATGATLVKAIAPAGPMMAWGNQLFVSAAGAHGAELWRTDGTDAGTIEVADIFVGPQSSTPSGLFVQSPNGPLMFTAATPEHGRELWSLEEPAGKPRLVADMAQGPESSGMLAIHQRGDTVYYYAHLDGRGSLWRTPDPLDAPLPLPAEETRSGCSTGTPWPRAGGPAAIVILGLLLRRRRRMSELH